MRKQRRRDLFKRRKKHRSEKKTGTIGSASTRKASSKRTYTTRRKNKYTYDYDIYDGEGVEYDDSDYEQMADDSGFQADGPHNPPKQANKHDPITDKVESLQFEKKCCY